MTKPNKELSKKPVNNLSNPIKQPTATVIPDSFDEPHLTGEPSKCLAVMTARQLEEDVFKIFTKALQQYKPDEVMFFFNGGKDCTVVLHMLNKFYQNNAFEHIKIPVLYIQSEDNFPEIDLFVDESKEFYNIQLIKMKGDLKTVLSDAVKEMPNIKAVFMGNRRTDPYCTDLESMHPTDPGWPPLMRINPIIDWSFNDVWTYIFIFRVPYCILYEQGYTSIGSRTNTKPNPHLRVLDSECKFQYHPAYMLKDGKYERAGRIKVQ